MQTHCSAIDDRLPVLSMIRMGVASGLVLLSFLATEHGANAAGHDKPVIAIVAPQSGPFAVLGRQIRRGIALGASDKAELVNIDETCEDDSGPKIGEAIVSAKADIAIGFLCTASLEGSLPRLAQEQIPAITLSVRSTIIMEDAIKKNWPLFRLAPSPTAERDALVDVIATRFKDQPFAIIDDGSINHHELADAVRISLEERGISANLVDNFRPAQDVQTVMIRRLVKAGIKRVLAIGEREDIAILVRDAKKQKTDMMFLGGDQLNAIDQDNVLPEGVLAVTIAEPLGADTKPAGVPSADEPAEGYVLPAQAATEVGLAVFDTAKSGVVPMATALIEQPFQTAIGPVRFGKDHELAINPFRLLRWNGVGFEAVPPLDLGN